MCAPFAAARTGGSRDNPHYSASRADCKRSTAVVPAKTVTFGRCNAGKKSQKNVFVCRIGVFVPRTFRSCIGHHAYSTAGINARQRPGTFAVMARLRGRIWNPPLRCEGDACHPKQITKTKNPRTNVRGFCLDVTKKIPCLKIHPIFCLLF